MRDSIFRSSKPMLGLAAAGLLLGVSPAAAHHSFALFDVSKSVMLEGEVKQFEWTNPHSWIHLMVTGENNQPEEWLIELPAAASLARDGWGKTYLKPGDRLSVRINPLKNGMKGGSLQSFRPENDNTP
ncbi:MAG TPA: DUF6152 family protein [Micropepsaceae bacterium]|jgi:hypothetical protein|nr:DUF6152 family protein [Micropepsaceae bacterium]